MLHQKQKGFTMMELMITLAVLAILVAITAPSMSGLLERRKVHGAGESLFANLIFAKTEAIKRNDPIRVSFTGNGTTWCYGIAVDATCDCTDNVPACEVDGVQKIVNQDDFAGVSVEAGSTLDGNVIIFDPLRGAASTVASSNLQFSVPSGAELGVRVSSFGRIRMCSQDFGFDACP